MFVINNKDSKIVVNVLCVSILLNTFNNDVKSKVHYGFIAQEFEKVYPNLVKNSEMGYKTVNYIELIPVLVSKIQDLNKEIQELKEKVK